MDQALIDQSIKYHGPTLVDRLAQEELPIQLPSFLSLSQASQGAADMPRDERLQEEITHFISKKADLMFAKQEAPPPFRDSQSDTGNADLFAVLPPLEAFMDVPEQQRRNHFYQSIKRGDIVFGQVSATQESGLIITVGAVDQGWARDVQGLKITTFCPLREVPKYYAHESPLEAFSIKDYVRGVVLNVIPENERIVISLQNKALPPDMAHLKMGLVNEEEIPLHYRRLQNIGAKSYGDHLQRILGFSNPSNVTTLSSKLGIKEDDIQPSIMRGLNGIVYPKSECAASLRKAQSYRWALKSVADGITKFKEGNHLEAMQLLNKALQIDEENVEAMVARGAVYANNESYNKAIGDFEAALRLNPEHKNARKYLCETLVALGAGHMDEENGAEKAIEYFERALGLDPSREDVRGLLLKVKFGEETKKGDIVDVDRDVRSPRRIEVSSEDEEEKKTLQKSSDTLRRLIAEEKSHKSKKKKKRKDSYSSADSPKYDKQQTRKRRYSSDSRGSSPDQRRQSRDRRKSPEDSYLGKSRSQRSWSKSPTSWSPTQRSRSPKRKSRSPKKRSSRSGSRGRSKRPISRSPSDSRRSLSPLSRKFAQERKADVDPKQFDKGAVNPEPMVRGQRESMGYEERDLYRRQSSQEQQIYRGHDNIKQREVAESSAARPRGETMYQKQRSYETEGDRGKFMSKDHQPISIPESYLAMAKSKGISREELEHLLRNHQLTYSSREDWSKESKQQGQQSRDRYSPEAKYRERSPAGRDYRDGHDKRGQQSEGQQQHSLSRRDDGREPGRAGCSEQTQDRRSTEEARASQSREVRSVSKEKPAKVKDVQAFPNPGQLNQPEVLAQLLQNLPKEGFAQLAKAYEMIAKEKAPPKSRSPSRSVSPHKKKKDEGSKHAGKGGSKGKRHRSSSSSSEASSSPDEKPKKKKKAKKAKAVKLKEKEKGKKKKKKLSGDGKLKKVAKTEEKPETQKVKDLPVKPKVKSKWDTDSSRSRSPSPQNARGTKSEATKRGKTHPTGQYGLPHKQPVIKKENISEKSAFSAEQRLELQRRTKERREGFVPIRRDSVSPRRDSVSSKGKGQGSPKKKKVPTATLR